MAGVYAGFAKELSWLASYAQHCLQKGQASERVPGGLSNDEWQAMLARDSAQWRYAADRAPGPWTTADELSVTLGTLGALAKQYHAAAGHFKVNAAPKKRGRPPKLYSEPPPDSPAKKPGRPRRIEWSDRELARMYVGFRLHDQLERRAAAAEVAKLYMTEKADPRTGFKRKGAVDSLGKYVERRIAMIKTQLRKSEKK